MSTLLVARNIREKRAVNEDNVIREYIVRILSLGVSPTVGHPEMA